MKVLKFYAEWCAPCKALSTTINGITNLTVEVVDIDIDQNPDIAVKYKVRGVPACILVDDAGDEIKRKVGSMTAAEFKAFIAA